MGKGKILRTTFALALIPTGAVVVLISGPGLVGQLMSSLGLALIVAGVTSAFREIAILRLESEETGEDIAARVHKRLQESPPAAIGIRAVAPVRRGYEGYYTWAINTGPQELFFAGRSVLHRIDFDFRERGLGSVEKVLARRLREGANISILFLDPRCDILERLAKEEGQTPTGMLSDIATSIGICKRLYGRLQGGKFHPQAQLQVRVYDEIPYFAYHKEDNKVIVGFYFRPALGWRSPAFEVIDAHTRSFFEGHFSSIFDRSSDRTLLELSIHRGTLVFNEELYQNLYLCLVNYLGKEKADQLISGSEQG